MKDIFSGYEEVTYRQAKALSILMEHYAQSNLCPEPICFGHNDWSGYYYIAFENISLQIVLDKKENVLWVTTDLETAEEEFFDTEEEAVEYLKKLENSGMFIDDEEWEKEMGR